MLFLQSWLEDYIDLKHTSSQQLAELITMKSSEVEEVTVVTDYYGGKVLVGQIRNLRPHPEADKLNIFDVYLGSDQSSVVIVSAAINVREGLFVPIAMVGTQLAFFKVGVRKLRGVESHGICLGRSELMLETQMSSGLWELEKEINKVGKNPQEILGMSICEVLPAYFPAQTVMDIKILPDKIGQAGNHLGMALEIASCLENMNYLTPRAQYLLNSADINTELEVNPVPTSQEIAVEFQDNTGYTNSFNTYQLQLTSEFILPHSLQLRMMLTNHNLIATPADLSNYLLADVGQPTHFFDTDKVKIAGVETQNKY